MTIQQANDIPIVEMLAREGFTPQRQNGRNWWYVSPIRVPEKTASFKVDNVINKWYDHGIGKGGGTLDLFMLLHRIDSVSEALNRLSSHSDSTINSGRAHQLFLAPSVQVSKLADNKIHIKNIYPLGENAYLVSYLQSRAIPFGVADIYCKAVDYELHGKKYFAIGFQNRSGGYELRNPFFKGSSSPKDVTHFSGKSEAVSLFEGFIDFLSTVAAKDVLPIKGDYMILNSISLLEKNLALISQYKEIMCFLDNDPAGKQGFSKLQTAGLNVMDASVYYQGSKDVNDWLISQRKENPGKYPRDVKRDKWHFRP